MPGIGASAEPRFFPPISNRFYDLAADADGGSHPMARSVLALAHCRLTWWQRLAALRLKGKGPVVALLRLHRLAFEAESVAAHDRADFYWREFSRVLPDVWANADAWQALHVETAAAAPVSPSVDQLKTAVACDVFRDAHRAFYAALSDASGSGAARADFHLARVLESFPYCGMTAAEERRVAGDPVAARVRSRLDAGELTAAMSLAMSLLDQFPNDVRYQSLGIHAAFKTAAARSKEQAPEHAVRDLTTSIDQLTEWRTRFDDHSELYEALSVLYVMRAIAQANAGAVAEAMLDVAKAEAANPALPDLADTRQQLAELMRNLQARMRTIEQTIASTPNAVLNDEGRRLKREAARGFEPAESWSRSDDCRAVVAGRTRGESRTVWRDVGLDDAAWNVNNGVMLLRALTDALRTPATTRTEIELAWTDAAERYGLQALHRDVVVEWLLRRRTPDAVEPTDPGPTIELANAPTDGRREPVGDWLAGRPARRVRYQLAAAALLAVIAGGIGAREAYRSSVRGRAWNAMQEATTATGILDAAERFFAVGSPAGESPGREQAMWQAYSESIVRAVAESGAGASSDAVKRMERYAATARRVGHNQSSGVTP